MNIDAKELSPSDLLDRINALEVAIADHGKITRDFMAGALERMEAMLTATSQRISAHLQSVAAPVIARAPAAVAASTATTKRDAWGKPLDGSGKVVALPPARPPAPAAVAGEAAACSCTDHEPAHGPNGCTVKGCSCSETG